MKTYRLVLLVLAILALLGCAPQPSAAPQPTAAGEPAEQIPVAATEPLATLPAKPMEMAAVNVEAVKLLQAQPTMTASGAQSLVDKAVQDLVQRLSNPDASPQVETLQVSQVVWADASLGCPSPDVVPAQTLTPGYLIVLKYSGKLYEYHADLADKLTYCENPAAPVAGLNSLVERALQDLARRLSVPLADINVVKAAEVTWPDGSLGCPREGMMVATVQTPGYQVVLENAGKQYAYHAAKDEVLVYCENPVAPGGTLEALIEMARQDLAMRQATDVSNVNLVESQEATWPDTSLGCPQPGMMYAQVETPGYLIKLRSQDGQFEYHTDRGSTLVLCASPAPGAPGLEPQIQMAKNDLAQRLSLLPDQVSLLEASAVTWPDSSLGCPQPGMMYAQMLTPGFRILFESGGKQYEYHAGSDKVFSYCESPSQPAPGNPN